MDESTTKRCTIEDCDNIRLCRGWCKKHYRRWQRHGDPLVTLFPTRTVGSSEERFWFKVDAEGICWEWVGARNDSGYGIFEVDNKRIRTHRYAWELLVGPIPDGLHIDHICRNRACCNPDHLEVVTPGENTRRGFAVAATKARAKLRTHCKNGHEFTEGNTCYPRGDNTRGCRRCLADATARYRNKRREDER